MHFRIVLHDGFLRCRSAAFALLLAAVVATGGCGSGSAGATDGGAPGAVDGGVDGGTPGAVDGGADGGIGPDAGVAADAGTGRCGDRNPDPGELCDDGNDDETDACANDCTPTAPFLAFDEKLKTLMQTWGIPGGAVAVTKDGRLVLTRAYGLANADTGEPVRRDSLFRIASLSKAITSAAILQLVEQGKLSLDEKAFSFLGDLPAPEPSMEESRLANITIRQLLQHSGGWDREVSFDPMFRSRTIASTLGESGPATAEMVVRYMRNVQLDFDPGTRYAYSNFGYCILGRIIERVTQQSYDAYVREHVLAPMGITAMRLGRTRLSERAPNEVIYYGYPGQSKATSVFPEDTTLVPWPYGGFYLESMDAHGGWLASAVDLSRFILAVDGRASVTDRLSATSIAEMIARPSLSTWSATAYWYGMGWLVRPSGGDANWWHGGSLPGTTTIFVRSYHGFTWVALFNSRPSNSGGFSGALDGAMWEALGTVSDWPDYDLFSRF